MHIYKYICIYFAVTHVFVNTQWTTFNTFKIRIIFQALLIKYYFMLSFIIKYYFILLVQIKIYYHDTTFNWSLDSSNNMVLKICLLLVLLFTQET